MNIQKFGLDTEMKEPFRDRNAAVEELRVLWNSGADKEEIFNRVWDTLELFQGDSFVTFKGLKYTYEIKGGEMIVSRKEKSITKATVRLAVEQARKMNGMVSGPKKLGVFGASYLFPVFVRIGIITGQEQ